MKRKANNATLNPRAQRPKYPEADYCDAIQSIDTNGYLVWPALAEALGIARTFLYGYTGTMIERNYSAAIQAKTLIVPEKDADGLDAGAILWKTLISLGLPSELVDVHPIGKNSTVHDEVERTAMQAKDPKYIIVVDQCSRAAPPIVDSADVKSLLIDHHQSDVFPQRPPRPSAIPN